MKEFNGTKIIAVDNGYGNTKTANFCFPTGISRDPDPLFTKDLLVYQGKKYLIGDGHKEFIGDKAADEDFYLLTLAGIAMELQKEGLTSVDVVLAVGLPLTWTGGQKEKYAKYLTRNPEVDFTFRKTDFHIRIREARVYPQGYAAIAESKNALKDLNLVCDIGNGTMNLLYIHDGKPVPGKMYTEKFGVYQCVLAVKEAIMRKEQQTIDDLVIEKILREGDGNISPTYLKIIKAEAARYVQGIFRVLREHGYDENTMMLYLTGGGACLVKNFARFKVDRTVFIDDICANAKGYEYLAETQMKKGQ